jgi:ABC-type sugar transport system substrate-binding protein
MRLPKGVLVLTVLVVLSALLAACGDDDDSGDSGGGTEIFAAEADDPGVQAAQEVVAEYVEERPFEEIPKVEQVPEGVKLTILTCALPSCQQTSSGAQEGAEALGWDVKHITYELRPEDYVSRFNEVVREPPDAFIFVSAFPNETVASQLATLEAANIPIAQIAPQAGEGPTPAIPSVILGFPTFEHNGEIAANMVIADGGPEAGAAIVLDPSLLSFEAAKEGWDRSFQENCPGCTTGEVEINLSAPAPQNLSKIINYLRENPDTKYVFFTNGDMAAGFSGELASAGLTDVKYFSLTPNEANMEAVANGSEWAAVSKENATQGWRGVDAIIRQLNGESVEPERYPLGYTRIYTEETAEPGPPPEPPGVPDVFLEAWGVNP